jgi:hypothetical protein
VDREEIERLLTEIEFTCNNDVLSFNIVPSNGVNSLSEGYELHIKIDCDKNLIQQIVAKNRLALRIEGELTVIYTPVGSAGEKIKGTPCEAMPILSGLTNL